jgi:hypothetical protein
MDLLRPFRTYFRWRAQRDEESEQEFERISADARAAGLRLGIVVRVRAYYRETGTKAWVVWLDDGRCTAIWVKQLRLSKRQIVAAAGRVGHGPHHREKVFYFDRCSTDVMSMSTYRGWRRHHSRLTEGAKRVRT